MTSDQRLILHIGATKTGSSALQQFLHQNRHRLAEQRVLYPDVGVVSNAHHLFSAALHPNAWRMHQGDLSENKDHRIYQAIEYADHIKEQADRLACGTIILSSEYFWGVLPDCAYSTLHKIFKSYELHVYAVVREPLAWIQSTYLQSLKHGESRKFLEWYQHFRRRRFTGVDYTAVLDRWLQGSAACEVTVRAYESLQGTEKFFSDILGSCHVTVRTGDLTSPKVPANPSPGPKAAALLQRVNASELDEPTKNELRRLIIQALPHRQVGSSLALASAEQHERLLTDYRPMVERLFEFYPHLAQSWPAALDHRAPLE